MAGTIEGGAKAAATNKKRYGDSFYARIGKRGGKAGYGPLYMGGFGGDRELASRAGALGGAVSKRGPIKRTWRLSWAIWPRHK